MFVKSGLKAHFFVIKKIKKLEQVAVKIREMIETICRQNGAFLLDTEVKGGGRNRLVILTVDTEQGITLAE